MILDRHFDLLYYLSTTYGNEIFKHKFIGLTNRDPMLYQKQISANFIILIHSLRVGCL